MLNGLTANNDIRLDNTSLAAFSKVNWEVTDRLTISPGVRINYDKKEGFYQRVVTTGCGQGTVFGSLMGELQGLQLPPGERLRQSRLYEMLAQVRAIETNDIGGIVAARISAIGTAQIAALSSVQVKGLTTGDMIALTSTQVAALTETQIKGLNATQLKGFTTTDISELSGTQVAALRELGVESNTLASFLALPNVAMVGGSWLTPADAVQAADWVDAGTKAELRQRAVRRHVSRELAEHVERLVERDQHGQRRALRRTTNSRSSRLGWPNRGSP